MSNMSESICIQTFLNMNCANWFMALCVMPPMNQWRQDNPRTKQLQAPNIRTVTFSPPEPMKRNWNVELKNEKRPPQGAISPNSNISFEWVVEDHHQPGAFSSCTGIFHTSGSKDSSRVSSSSRQVSSWQDKNKTSHTEESLPSPATLVTLRCHMKTHSHRVTLFCFTTLRLQTLKIPIIKTRHPA